MPVLEIVKNPAPVLRQRAKPVVKITDPIRRLVDDMIETMREAPGLGLAAPQVNQNLRLFVYEVGEEVGVIINPEIVHRAGEERGIEGCLSIPGLEGEVPRAKVVEVVGLDAAGKRVRLRREDLVARVFQHEIDHLDGILFTDRADPTTLKWVNEKEEVERPQRRVRRGPPAPQATPSSG